MSKLGHLFIFGGNVEILNEMPNFRKLEFILENLES